MPRALILTDGKAGHENQSKAFARALGCDFDVLSVRFKSGLHKALSYPLDRLGVRTLGLLRPERPFPACGDGFDVVIGTGSGTFYAAKALARRLGVKSGVVLYPRGYDVGSFGCVMAPAFDRPAPRANVVEIPANLVAADEAFYAKGVSDFLAKAGLPAAPEEAVAVIVGGPNKCSTLTAGWMRARLDEIFAANRGAKLWVTTSRRTPAEVEAVVDAYPWDWRLLYSKDHFNPIPAFVKLARRLYVTAESTGMLSEACTFGAAEVFALDNLKPGPHKFRRFVENLRRDGYVGAADGRPSGRPPRKVSLAAEFARAKALLGI